MEKGLTQSWHFWSNFDPSFPPKDGQYRKKTSSSEDKLYLRNYMLTSCKKAFVKTFSSFAAIDHRGHFRKI